MRILITGNMGYVGTELVQELGKEFTDAELIGYDVGYFGSALTATDIYPETRLHKHYFKDIRDVTGEILVGIDVIIHLAAISNDPMGNEFELVTEEINRLAGVNLIHLAAQAGVRSFVFASSCSMYGQAAGRSMRESDPLNPLTAYARSKAGLERDVSAIKLGRMTFTSLRFATACGWSNRLRLDLVLNDFVASALTFKKVAVLSDGTPWRPLIDVKDMCRAIIWAISRGQSDGGQFIALNIGSRAQNYQVGYLAEEVARHIPGTKVEINTNATTDKRSYSVDFSLFEQLAPNHQPNMTLEDSIKRVAFGLSSIGFQDLDFRSSPLMRLNMLRGHIRKGNLSKELRWIGPKELVQ